GKWILDNILGTPPPPPPPNVPPLTEENPVGKVLTMRERMAQHRTNPACSSCHQLMDPIGLSFENFDAIGRWRTRGDGDVPIDAKMALPRRTFLRGMGVTSALPLLDAMAPALSAMTPAASTTVRRLAFVYIPMGMNPEPWVPKVEGKLTQLSPSLASLTPFLD